MNASEDLQFPFMNTYEIAFRGVEYLFNIKAQTDKLNLLVEERLSTNRWRGELTDEDCEHITDRAKTKLSYPSFIKLLVYALMNKSDQVFLDLLSKKDLLMIQAK